MPYQGRLPYTYKSPFNTTLDQGTQTVPSLAFLGDTNNGLFSPAIDNVAITTNGSEKLRVTSGGFVGIGTTNPQTTLQVWGNGRFGSTSAVGKVGLLQTNGNENAYIELAAGDNSLNLYGYGGINLQANGTNPTPVRGTYGIAFQAWSSRPVYFDGYGGFGGDVIMRDSLNNAEVFHAYMGDGTGGSSRKVTFPNGNVGIGVTNPSVKFEVRADNNEIRSTGSSSNYTQYNAAIDSGVACRIGAYAVNWGYIGTTTNHPLRFETNSTTAVTIDTSQRVGIGTTNPGYTLDVQGSQNVTTQISLWGRTIGQPQTLVEPGRIYATAAGLGPGNLLLQPTGGNLGIGTTNPQKTVHIYSSSPIRFEDQNRQWDTNIKDGKLVIGDNTASADRLTIDTSGNVGIGTTNPLARLHVVSSSAEQVRLTKNGAEGLEVFLGNSTDVNLFQHFNRTLNTWVENRQNALRHTFANSGNGNEVFRIESNGNVGIGTTNPLDKLHVSGGNIRTTGGYLTMFGLATPNHENYIQMTGNGTSYIGVGPEANPTIKFKIGNTSTTVLNVSSTAVTPGADNTYNLGSTSFRWANIYSADLQLSNEGSSNDVDGTWGAYTIQEGENDLYLLNRRNGKKYKFVLQEVN